MRSGKSSPSTDIDNNLLELAEVLNPSEEDHTPDLMISVLKKCIEHLKPAYRDIIIAVDFEGYTYKEIAQETGIPAGTLMSQRHRAISQLYKKLEKQH